MKIYKNILEVSEFYDAFLVDIYGVLYDGQKLYDGILDTMLRLKKANKKIIILSNVTQSSADAIKSYEKRGIYRSIHCDEFVTSGEVLKHDLENDMPILSKELGKKPEKFSFLFKKNINVFSSCTLQETSDFSGADFLYIGVPSINGKDVDVQNLSDASGSPLTINKLAVADWKNIYHQISKNIIQEFAAFQQILDQCLSMNKTLVCANPDFFAHETITVSQDGIDTQTIAPVIRQGAIAMRYQSMGGKVVYFGKPHKAIYDYAINLIERGMKVAMVGDTPWTDISGANNVNIGSVMTLTGVSKEFIVDMSNDLSQEEKLNKLLFEIAPNISTIKTKQNFVPTHIIEKFA